MSATLVLETHSSAPLASLSRTEQTALAKPIKHRCEQAILPKIPVKEFMDIALFYFEVHNKGPTDRATLEDAVSILESWEILAFRFSKRYNWKLIFFRFTSGDNESLDLCVEFERRYVQTNLVAIQKTLVFSDGYYYEPEEPSVILTCEELIRTLGFILEEVNQNIDQWNFICSHSLPIFTSPLPQKELVEKSLESLRELILDEAYSWARYEKKIDPDDFSETELIDMWAHNDGAVYEYHMLWALREGWYANFGSKQDWHTFCVVLESEMHYPLVYFIVAREKVRVAFSPVWFETFGEGVIHVSECDKVFIDLIESIQSSMLQWNRFVGGEFELDGSPKSLSTGNVGEFYSTSTEKFIYVHEDPPLPSPGWVSIPEFVNPDWFLPEGCEQLKLPF